MTIREYFGELVELAANIQAPDDYLLAARERFFALVSDGTIDLDTEQNRQLGVQWFRMVEPVLQAVHENGDFEFQGRYSCAMIMGAAMGIYRRVHRFDFPPPCWYQVIKQLRATPGRCTPLPQFDASQ